MIKVFGIGNPLLMDDGIGIEVTKGIAERITEDEDREIKIFISEIYVEDALDQIEEGDYIVIIDATYFGGRAGEVHILSFEDCRRFICPQVFCHHRSLLYTLVEDYPQIRGELIGIEICCVDYKEGLSKRMTEMLPWIVKKVSQRLEYFCKQE